MPAVLVREPGLDPAAAFAGRVVALINLPDAEEATIVQALHTARAFPCVLRSGDAVAIPPGGELFDLVVIDASLDWDAVGSGMPVLFVGPPDAIARRTPMLHRLTQDCLMTPCDVDQFLIRASRLLKQLP